MRPNVYAFWNEGWLLNWSPICCHQAPLWAHQWVLRGVKAQGANQWLDQCMFLWRHALIQMLPSQHSIVTWNTNGQESCWVGGGCLQLCLKNRLTPNCPTKAALPFAFGLRAWKTRKGPWPPSTSHAAQIQVQSHVQHWTNPWGKWSCKLHHTMQKWHQNKGQSHENATRTQGCKCLWKNHEDWQITTHMRLNKCIKIWLLSFTMCQKLKKRANHCTALGANGRKILIWLITISWLKMTCEGQTRRCKPTLLTWKVAAGELTWWGEGCENAGDLPGFLMADQLSKAKGSAWEGAEGWKYMQKCQARSPTFTHQIVAEQLQHSWQGPQQPDVQPHDGVYELLPAPKWGRECPCHPDTWSERGSPLPILYIFFQSTYNSFWPTMEWHSGDICCRSSGVVMVIPLK